MSRCGLYSSGRRSRNSVRR